jgi:hypothetical protein
LELEHTNEEKKEKKTGVCESVQLESVPKREPTRWKKDNIKLSSRTNISDYNWWNPGSLFPGSLELFKDVLYRIETL